MISEGPRKEERRTWLSSTCTHLESSASASARPPPSRDSSPSGAGEERTRMEAPLLILVLSPSSRDVDASDAPCFDDTLVSFPGVPKRQAPRSRSAYESPNERSGAWDSGPTPPRASSEAPGGDAGPLGVGSGVSGAKISAMRHGSGKEGVRGRGGATNGGRSFVPVSRSERNLSRKVSREFRVLPAWRLWHAQNKKALGPEPNTRTSRSGETFVSLLLNFVLLLGHRVQLCYVGVRATFREVPGVNTGIGADHAAFLEGNAENNYQQT